MFAKEREIFQLQLCDRAMFGDMVITCQTPVTSAQKNFFPATMVIAPTRSRSSSDSSKIREDRIIRNDQRRASALVDQLLVEIYSKNSNSFSGYTSTTSVRSHKSFKTAIILHQKNTNELLDLIGYLESHVVRAGSILVRQLKRRDALRRQRDAHCDVISEHLHIRGPENAEMRFSMEPAPGDSGFSQWNSAMRMVAQLPEGIPPEFRRKLWLNLADRHLTSRNVDWAKVERECFSEWSHPADGELGIQIVKDLHRTGCSLFCGEDGQENQALLKRVLLAYARWNKVVGYCQGFNMLAALILQVTDKCETEALKLMIYLIEGVLPESYFADSLRGLSVDMAVFRELLRARLPRLSRHLDTLQVAAKDGTTSYEPPLTNVFTMQWFLTLFCNCLPQPTVLRVWDLILLEGNEILLRTALAIWQTLAERILSVRSADEFYCIMGVLTREILEFGIVDANSLIKAVVAIGPLTELPSLREKYLYNINPWGSSLSTARYTRGEVKERQLKVYHREKLALDISALKKQYSKLRQRQRQAHIIFNAAVTRSAPSRTPPVAMNHLLLGKSALVPTKRIGPPLGAIPPARQLTPSIVTTTKPKTLHWKDAPQKDSSSSSSSDTELCDDPDDIDEVATLSNSPAPSVDPVPNSQLNQDNLNKTSDNFHLMNSDNTSIKILGSDSEKNCDEVPENLLDFDSAISGDFHAAIDCPAEIGQTTHTAENTETIKTISDIFDTSSTNNELFDFNKYGIQSDSEDESFDFERFLEDRVRCLKQNNVDSETCEGNVTDYEKEESKTEYTRRNSQRALEIIQENSLILHRILQCQSRLTPPPIPEADDHHTTPHNAETDILNKHDNNPSVCRLSPVINEQETTPVYYIPKQDILLSPHCDYSTTSLLEKYCTENTNFSYVAISPEETSVAKFKFEDDAVTAPVHYSTDTIDNGRDKIIKDNQNYKISSPNDIDKYKYSYDESEDNISVVQFANVYTPELTNFTSNSCKEHTLSPTIEDGYGYSKDQIVETNNICKTYFQTTSEIRENSFPESTKNFDDNLSEEMLLRSPSRSKSYVSDLVSIAGKIKNFGTESRRDKPLTLSSILDTEFSRSLDEKYNTLILQSSVLDTENENTTPMDLSFITTAGEDVYKEAPNIPLSPQKLLLSPMYKFKPPSITYCDKKSPNSDSDSKTSSGESSTLKSPTTGRIYNPFPVTITSRQNKDIAVRLGLYKKS